MASKDGRLDFLVNAAGGAAVGGLMDLDDERVRLLFPIYPIAFFVPAPSGTRREAA